MKKLMTKHAAAASCLALTMMATSVFAANEADDSWRFGVTIPLWAPQINGDVTIRGVEQDVDISFDELKDHLDASFALGLEARKGKFGLYSGFGYMKFTADGSVAGGSSADAELKFIIADAGVSYLLTKTEGERPFFVEAIAGIRYWRTDTDLTIRDSGGGVIFSGGDDRDLVDPIIGLRGSKYLTAKCHLDFAGDVGGFGISDNQADLDWSATGLVTYDFVKWFSLSGGYKALALDVSRGSGASENGVNVVFNGLLIAAKFKF